MMKYQQIIIHTIIIWKKLLNILNDWNFLPALGKFACQFVYIY